MTLSRAETPRAATHRAAAPSSLTLRVLSGVVLVPLLLGVAYFGDLRPGSIGGIVYGLLICAACGFASFELRLMLRSGGYQPVTALLVGLAVALPLDAWLRPGGDVWSAAPDGLLITIVALLLSLIWLLGHGSSERALVDWAVSLGLAIYIGGLMQFYFPLRRVPSELPGQWVLALLVLSWVCDSSAYFVGRAIGRIRLAPVISPKKSVEGALAGLLAAGLVGLLLSLPLGVSPPLLAGYGVIIGVATVLGDLVESLVKRQMRVKDSGVLIPGHGGLLDRMDSLLFCAPAAVFYLHLVLG